MFIFTKIILYTLICNLLFVHHQYPAFASIAHKKPGMRALDLVSVFIPNLKNKISFLFLEEW